MYNRLAIKMNKCVQKTEISKWMTKVKTTLIQKDRLKGTAQTNYRPKTCLLMMWKVETARIKEGDLLLIVEQWNLPDKQKGCHEKTRG